MATNPTPPTHPNNASEANPNDAKSPILVIGGNGKTGRLVFRELEDLGYPAYKSSSQKDHPTARYFDWNKPQTWAHALEGVQSVYVVYSPDLAVPAAPKAITQFTQLAKQVGVKHLVLLSGRGEEEAQLCESIVQQSGLDWTIVRASWFNQNFDQGSFLDFVRNGQIPLPAGEVKEPFIDIRDIADVVVAALTQPGHRQKIYEVTGPRLMSFHEVAQTIGQAINRPVEYIPISHEAFKQGLIDAQTPEEMTWLLSYLFEQILDGRNAWVADGVEQALGRPARDFADYAQQVAQTNIWQQEVAV